MGILPSARAFDSSTYYLTITNYPLENFCSTIQNHKNHENLAQQSFPHFTVIPISVQVSITILYSNSSGIINVKTTVVIPALKN